MWLINYLSEEYADFENFQHISERNISSYVAELKSYPTIMTQLVIYSQPQHTIPMSKEFYMLTLSEKE